MTPSTPPSLPKLRLCKVSPLGVFPPAGPPFLLVDLARPAPPFDADAGVLDPPFGEDFALAGVLALGEDDPAFFEVADFPEGLAAFFGVALPLRLGLGLFALALVPGDPAPALAGLGGDSGAGAFDRIAAVFGGIRLYPKDFYFLKLLCK
jgi:hypothetical protein